MSKNNEEEIYKIAESISYLYDRWQDESEYEDFAEYVEYAKRVFDNSYFSFKSLTKNPFQIIFCNSSETICIQVDEETIIIKELA